MRIFCYLHFFPPVHNAGSETTVHAAMREMVRRGHEVTVLADQTLQDYEIDGIRVISLPHRNYTHDWVVQQAQGYDLLITHLDCSGRAMQLHLDTQIPLVHFIHNTMQIEYHHIMPNKAQLVIFNSEWVAKAQRYRPRADQEPIPWDGESIVMHPIVEPDSYRCERGEMITFCNPTDGKGVATVHRLSELLPHRQFLIVEGHYGEQVAPPHLGDDWVARHPNVTHIKNDPEFRNVLRRTKVLLMPSNYESYGRCAVEAACAGIPSVVHPTEGLVEALGDAALYCDRAQVEDWAVTVEHLMSDDAYYKERSEIASAFADTLDPAAEFNRLEQALIKIWRDWLAKQEKVTVKTWVSDQRIWETTDGKLVAEVDGRMPRDVRTMIYGVGDEIPVPIAEEYGYWKRVTAPEENKMRKQAQTQNKQRAA